MIYTLVPNAQGYLEVRGGYKPGDILQLKGKFKAVALYDIAGEPGKPIFITNPPNETTYIDQITWAGGSWAHGLAMRKCRHVVAFGTTQSQFQIIGSNSTATDSNGAPMRGAFFNLIISEFSNNITVHDMTISYGGTGVLCKTDVAKADSNTWFPNTYLDNFEFFNLKIHNTINEAMYIGHTASYWNINNNTPLYPGVNDPTPDAAIYKRPIKLRNVKIRNNYIHDTGVDAIQTAAIDNLEIINNEIKNWAIQKNTSHNGGILVGGRVVNFEVRDNYVHDGWGEFLQIYADAGKAVVKNNLLVRNSNTGVGLRGGKGLAVEFTNNTMVSPGHDAFRINGHTGGTGNNTISKNVIAGLATGRKPLYVENGGAATMADNLVYPVLADAKLSDKFVSPTAGYGYTPTVQEPEEPEIKMVVSISLPTLVLKEGAHDLKLTMPDGTVGNIKVTVEREK